jgi:hypothetical protein
MRRRAVERARRTSEQARLKHVLGFEVLDEIDGFLKRHSMLEPYTPSDFERKQRALDRPGSLRGCDGRRRRYRTPIATERVA